MAENIGRNFSCKLTSPQLMNRKSTVIAELKGKITDRIETENGFKYRFSGDDNTLDKLVTFIKTERQCCPFFVFNLSVTDASGVLWLEITGAQNVKDFISAEMEM